MLNWRNVLVGVVLSIALVAFLWFVPQLHSYQNVPPEEVSALKNEVRRTWAQIIGGIVLLLGLYATWRRVEIAERTLEVAQDQQVTERFTRAIDQLGATDDKGTPRLEIRLGGIYALERIARDSPERDYSTVMEVLSAYVRENAPWLPASESGEEGDVERDKEPMPQFLRTDIQAILDVIRRRDEQLVILDLRSTNLRRGFLPTANLRGASFADAHLERTHLTDAHLEGAILMGAHLQGADLGGAHLQGAYLQGADLGGAKLQRADLRAKALTQDQIDAAYGDENTKLPEGLVRPAHWSKSSDEQQNGEE